MSPSQRPKKTYRIKLDAPEGAFEADLQVAEGPLRLGEMAYAVLGISSATSEAVERASSRYNFNVSCKAGCGACCRQLVPISPAEAMFIGEMVESIPEPKQTAIRERFAAIGAKTRETGLWDDIQSLDEPSLSEADHTDVARRYFALHLACPFLVDESCSIHRFRPTICREYAVVSPAENCSDPFTKPVNQLPMPVRMSDALARVSAECLEDEPQLIPLSLALEWFEANKEHQWKAWDSQLMIEALMGYMRGAIEGRKKPGQTSK